MQNAQLAAAHAELVEDRTVGDLLRRAAELAPETTALVEGVADPDARRRWTYAQLLADAEVTARTARPVRPR